MKHILALLATALSFICHAQNFGFNKIDTMQLSFSPLSVTSVSAYLPKYFREVDTVKVIILYCDTATGRGSYVNFNGIYQVFPTLSMFAYSIREKHNTAEGLIDPGFDYGAKYVDYWQQVRLLGFDKKPLPKNIVIWMVVDAK